MNEVFPDLDQSMDAPGTIKPTGTQKPLSPGQQRQQKQQQGQQRKQQQARPIRPGQIVKLPTKDGTEQEFKVTRDMGNEVEIENPDGLKSPSQPSKLVYSKADLEKAARNRQ